MTEQTPTCSFLVLGAGAIGTYLGGTLAAHGHQVIFVERPRKFNELRERGFTIRDSGQRVHLPDPHLESSPEEALTRYRFDLAIYTLKTYHAGSLAADLEGIQKDFPPVLCLQNGVGTESLLAAVLGWEKILPGTITTAVSKHSTGNVTVENQRGLGLGGDHQLIPRLQDTFSAAGLAARCYPDWQSMKWSKLFTNLIGNATSAILDWPPDRIYRNAAGYELETRQLKEALAVIQAEGLQPVSLPGIPVKSLAFLIRSLPAPLGRLILSGVLGRGRGEKMPSFHIDLESGRERSEVQWLNGAVADRGNHHGVPTPVNALLTQTLMKLIRGEIPRQTYAGRPEKLLAQLDR